MAAFFYHQDPQDKLSCGSFFLSVLCLFASSSVLSFVFVPSYQKVLFTRGELTHEALRVEIFTEKKKPVVLVTNNFEFSVEDVSEIYRLRWAIESLYKQLKQNFPLHFFYGDSVNAIQIQTWVVLIANLLITVLSKSIKRNCAFSQVVTMVRLTLMYYIDFVTFMENPDKTWDSIHAKEEQKGPPEPTLFN